VSDWSGKWFPGIRSPQTARGRTSGHRRRADRQLARPGSRRRGARECPARRRATGPAQPPARAGRPPGPAALRGRLSGYGRRPTAPAAPRRRIVAIVALVIVVLLVVSIGLYFYLDSKLTRANVLVDYAGRPVAVGGQNWLITGSDSRQGLTRAQEAQTRYRAWTSPASGPTR